MRISNFDVKEIDGKPEKRAVQLPDLVEATHAATDRVLIRVGHQLGYVDAAQRPHRFVPLASPDALMTWLRVHPGVDLSWTGTQVQGPDGREDSITRREYFEALRASPTRAFDALAHASHEPTFESLLYLDPVAPAAGSALNEFLAMLNPATDIDARLLAAATLTPGWGSTRTPVFVLTSTHGVGSGKTSTATAIARLWGGAITPRLEDGWQRVMSNLLSPGAVGRRVVLIDNVRRNLDVPGLEDAITADRLGGHRLYAGYEDRLNDLVFFIAENDPSLTRDLSSRAVVIRLGAPIHQVDFRSAVDAFMQDHGRAAVAAALDVLRDGPRHDLNPKHSDRFQAWQRAVLCTQPNPDELATAIEQRRREYDADARDREALLDDLALVHGFISSRALALRMSETLERSVPVRGVGKLVERHRLPFTRLRRNHTRGWQRIEPAVDASDE